VEKDVPSILVELAQAVALWAAVTMVALPLVYGSTKHQVPLRCVLILILGIAAGWLLARFADWTITALFTLALWASNGRMAQQMAEPEFRIETGYETGAVSRALSQILLVLAVLAAWMMFAAQVCTGGTGVADCRPLFG
jgi:hypothetical protein